MNFNYSPLYSARLFSVSQIFTLKFNELSKAFDNLFQQTIQMFSNVGIKFLNSGQSRFRFL